MTVAEVVAEAVGPRLEDGERLRVRPLLDGVRAAGRERHLQVVAGVLGRLLDRRAPSEHDQVGERDALAAPVLGTVELVADGLQLLEDRRQLAGLVDLPALLRLQSHARAVRAAPRFSA